MRALLTALVAVGIAATPARADMIWLKNGRTLEVEGARIEERAVVFELHGVEVRLSADFVERVRLDDDVSSAPAAPFEVTAPPLRPAPEPTTVPFVERAPVVPAAIVPAPPEVASPLSVDTEAERPQPERSSPPLLDAAVGLSRPMSPSVEAEVERAPTPPARSSAAWNNDSEADAAPSTPDIAAPPRRAPPAPLPAPPDENAVPSAPWGVITEWNDAADPGTGASETPAAPELLGREPSSARQPTIGQLDRAPRRRASPPASAGWSHLDPGTRAYWEEQVLWIRSGIAAAERRRSSRELRAWQDLERRLRAEARRLRIPSAWLRVSSGNGGGEPE